MHEQSRRIYDTGGVSPTIHTMGGGNTEVKVAILKQNVSEDTNKPRALGHIPYPGSDKPHQSNTFYDSKAVSPTLDTCEGGNRQVKILVEKDLPLALDEQNQYIRTDGTVGTIMTDGSSPKHNNRVIEPIQPRKDIKDAERYCEYCGKQLVRKRFNGRLEDFNVFLNRKYCDRECMKRGYLKIGENNQSYSNAHTTARKINELVLHKEACEICGSTSNLDIHHIDGNWQNNNLNNLMCLCRSCHTKHEKNKESLTNYRIRKLTPKECWRLQGFDDEDFEKAQKVNSNTQLYKQAGNSIVVDVLEGILGALLISG